MTEESNNKAPFPSRPFPSSVRIPPRVTRSATKMAENAQDFPGEIRNTITTAFNQPQRVTRGGKRGRGRGHAPNRPFSQPTNVRPNPPKMEIEEIIPGSNIESTCISSIAPQDVKVCRLRSKANFEIVPEIVIKEGNVTKAVLKKIVLVEEKRVVEQAEGRSVTNISSQYRTYYLPEDERMKDKKVKGSQVYVPAGRGRYQSDASQDFSGRGPVRPLTCSSDEEGEIKSKPQALYDIPPGRIPTHKAVSQQYETGPRIAPATSRTLSVQDVETASVRKLNLLDDSKWPMQHKKPLFKVKVREINDLMQAKTPFIDSHCHLDFIYPKVDKKKESDEYLDAWKNDLFPGAFPPNFAGCIPNFIEPALWYDQGNGCYDLNWIKKQLESPYVFGGTYGVHPHEATRFHDAVYPHLDELLAAPDLKAIAVGECGLDAQSGIKDLKREQIESFRKQVNLAKKHDLPIVIHCRGPNKGDDYQIEKKCLEIMKEEKLSRWHSIHRHCFKVDFTAYSMWVKAFPNTFFGITPLTGPIDDGLKQAIEKIPLSRLLLETDAPYFLPRQFDGVGPNGCSLPGMAICAAEVIAQLKNIDLEAVLTATTQNTRRCYGLYDNIVD